MAHKVWTAEELEQLSPAEQDAIFEAGIVRDLGDVPPEFLARVRARLDDHIASTERLLRDDGSSGCSGHRQVLRGPGPPAGS